MSSVGFPVDREMHDGKDRRSMCLNCSERYDPIEPGYPFCSEKCEKEYDRRRARMARQAPRYRLEPKVRKKGKW